MNRSSIKELSEKLKIFQTDKFAWNNNSKLINLLDWYIKKYPGNTKDYLRYEKWKGNSREAMKEISFLKQVDELKNEFGVNDFHTKSSWVQSENYI